MMKETQKTNWILTIILIIGTITVFFPLYMAIIIAFKQPSEMTNDVAGALAFPSRWSLENFRQAMGSDGFLAFSGKQPFDYADDNCTGNFNSFYCRICNWQGYDKQKELSFYLSVHCQRYVCSVLHPDDAFGKTDGADGIGKPYRGNPAISCFLYADECDALHRLFEEYTGGTGETSDIDGASTWKTYWKIVFPMMKPMHATVAILTALGTWNDVMTPLVIMSGTGHNTLPLAQLNFQSQFGTNYNLAFASYILALLPILVFYMICQKQILNGVANGAVKG